MIELRVPVQRLIEAPCAPESRVDIIHSGFRIVEQTDAAGRLDIRVPALTQDARFTAVFPASARRFTAQVNIPEVAGYDRVALQASEPGPLGIEPLTNGTTPISAIASVEAEGSESAFGYLLRLGRPEGSDIGQLDIFSFPRENTQSLGVVRLNVRADVTTDTCGREIPAIAAQTRHGGAHRQVQVDIALPGCDAVGDTLVLKNILQDLKLASN